MSDNKFKLFVDGAFRLTKTISIKSEYSARQTNNAVTLLQGMPVDDGNPHTWKEYLNRAGIYHAGDVPMTVISLDTLQPIDFTVEALVLHPATKNGYRLGSRYYKELVEKYPYQETLIKGILYPAKLDDIVQAPDYSILSWDTTLVEPNEEDLIRDLDIWTRNFANRWFIKGFTFSHSMYASAFFATMFQLMPLVILNLRARAVKTRQVHSFHVESYLASHKSLDEFLPYLTEKQKYWLYRNITYLKSHAGKVENFNDLTENILTDVGIPLMGYDIVHNASSLSESNLVPEVAFKQTSENRLRSAVPELIAPETVLDKIAQVAEGNPEYRRLYPRSISDLGYQKQDKFTSKILETENIENNRGADTNIIEVAMSHWAMASGTNRFNVFIRINHPITGEEITMSVKDAYYAFWLAYSNAHAVALSVVPPLVAMESPNWPLPPVDALKSVSITQGTPEGYVELMRESMPAQSNYINLEQFRTMVTRLELAQLQHKNIIDASDFSPDVRQGMKNVYMALWNDKLITAAETGQAIDDYLESKSISFGALTKEFWEGVYLTIFREVTGLEMEVVQDQNATQVAMVNIMRRLSSYSIVFVDPKEGASTSGLEWDYIFVEESSTSSTNVYDVHSASIDVTLVQEISQLVFEIGIGDIEAPLTAMHEETIVEIGGDVFIEPGEADDADRVTVLGATIAVQPYNDSGELEPGFVAGLTETEQMGEDLVDVPNIYNYEDYPRPAQPGPIDPNELIVSQFLPIDFSANKSLLLRDFKALEVPKRLRYFANDSTQIVLNAFWLFSGQSDLDVFSFSGGKSVVDPFKPLPRFDFEIPSWKPNIGKLIPRGIGPYTEEEGAIDIGSFVPVYGDLDFAFTSPATGYRPINLAFYNLSSTIDIEFTAFNYTLDVGFNHYNGETIEMDSFVNASNPAHLAFSYLGSKVEMPSFTVINTGGNISIGFTPSIAVIQLLPFELPIPTIVLDPFVHLIPVQLDAFYKAIAPIDIPDLDIDITETP